MAYQKVFKRYELKYMLTQAQKERIIEAIEPYMTMDRFGRSTIRNIYFDTDDYILARHSIAKPDFKEKLRVWSYSQASAGDKVFVELKRKYDHVVYKRRVALPEHEAMAWTTGASGRITELEGSAQMKDEIDYFLSYYRNLRPAVFLSYDREAYKMKDGSDFRVTFDENVLCRDFDISLTSPVYGTPVLEPGRILMELKCSGCIPMWMVRILSEEKIYKTSFSKYGTAYTDLIFPELTVSQAGAHAAARSPQSGSSQPAQRMPVLSRGLLSFIGSKAAVL